MGAGRVVMILLLGCFGVFGGTEGRTKQPKCLGTNSSLRVIGWSRTGGRRLVIGVPQLLEKFQPSILPFSFLGQGGSAKQGLFEIVWPNEEWASLKPPATVLENTNDATRQAKPFDCGVELCSTDYE